MPPRKKKTKPEDEESIDFQPEEITDDSNELEEVDEYVGALKLRPVVIKRKSRGGRPSGYKPEYAKIAKLMLTKGATVVEIADSFGVTVQTIWNWRNAHEAFFEAFLDLNENFDKRVEYALGQRAVGYDYDDIKVFNNNGVPVIVPIKKHLPADVNAAKFWLAARQGAKWKVREELEVTGDEAFKQLLQSMGKKKEGDQ